MGTVNFYVIGDFNVVLGEHERCTTAPGHTIATREFQEFLDEADFFEIEAQGSAYTWVCRRSNKYIAAKLDRALASQQFLDLWATVGLNILPRWSSDHHPLKLVLTNDVPTLPRPFRFQSMWLSHDGFLAVVRDSWSQTSDIRNPVVRVASKLRNLRTVLRQWNSEIFRNVFVEIDTATAALEAIQQEIAREGDSDSWMSAEIEKTMHLNDLLARRNLFLRQRNRLQWLTDGDRNSAFFHRLHSIWKTQSSISHIRDGSDFINTPAAIGAYASDYYANLFSEEGTTSTDFSCLDGFLHPTITDANNLLLTALPSAEEIHTAVLDLDEHSSPGPDGFGGFFYRGCWDIISIDVIAAVLHFFTHLNIPNGINVNLVALIPKFQEADRIQDFRPIASVHNISGFHNLLVHYGQISGQIFSPSKSRVFYSSKTSRAVKVRMLRSNGIVEGSMPFTYLGVPIFRGTPRVSYFAEIVDSVLTKFSRWKGSSLSLAGRRCLINSVIAASLERCCAPITEGGLGIRSIRLANESFLCKLAWDLLRNEDPAMSVVHDRYLFDNGAPRNFYRVSSIWTGVHRHFPRLISQSQWLVGTSSLVCFWTDNWLGYKISEKIGLPDELLENLVSTVNEFYYDGCWHFEESFFMRYTRIVIDIINLKFIDGTDKRICPNSCSGELSSRTAYGFLHSSLPNVSWADWI
ncbi:hypothetical protein ACS0TY_013240 [Phlomoides rotata]